MSYVQTIYQSHPKNPFANFNAQNAAGSLIILFDLLLVDGGPTINIDTITRDGVNAVIKTTLNHDFVVGDKILIADTGEANFNGVKRVEQVLTTDEVVVFVENTGSTSVSAGTVKWASAGWTKYYSGSYEAIYQSADLYDGAPFYLQLLDDNTVTARVRVGRNVTAMNVGELLTPETYIKKGETKLSYCIFADNKTIHASWNQTILWSIGYGKKIDEELELLMPPSIYAPSATTTALANNNYPSSGFGYKSDLMTNMAQNHSSCCILASDPIIASNSIGITSILGRPISNNAGGAIGISSSPSFLDNSQNGIRGVNTLTGKMQLCSVDIWEKIAEIGDCFQPNCRVRGFYQAYARLPYEYISTSPDLHMKMKIKIDNVDTNFIAVNYYVNATNYSQLFINVDSWED